jgi:hypothetical protein
MANATTQDEIIFKRCAGLDVHQAEITAAVRLVSDGGRVVGHTKRFATTPTGLSELRDWLAEFDVTHVAMEGTGVYWEPVYAALRGRFDLTVCNAHHVKNVSGRKTDQSDASWLAQLLSYGVLKKSFVPPDQIRELRELTRTRVHRVEDRVSAIGISAGHRVSGLDLRRVTSAEVLVKSGLKLKIRVLSSSWAVHLGFKSIESGLFLCHFSLDTGLVGVEICLGSAVFGILAQVSD